VHPDRAVVADLDVLEHPEVLDRLADLRVEDVLQRLANLFLGDQESSSRGEPMPAPVTHIILIPTVLTGEIPWARNRRNRGDQAARDPQGPGR
jgi:hypothetical protein